MSYAEEKRRLISYVTRNGEIIALTPDKSNAKQYYRELQLFGSGRRLAIRYPGYKTTRRKCDYCVYLVDENGEWPISHAEIMQDLYNKTTLRNYAYMKRYVEAVASLGKDIVIPDFSGQFSDGGFSFEELTALMFYIAIQEDINYPESYYQGRKMCFYRYLEAVYCKVNRNHTLYQALARAAARYIPKKWNDVGDLYRIVSEIQR